MVVLLIPYHIIIVKHPSQIKHSNQSELTERSKMEIHEDPLTALVFLHLANWPEAKAVALSPPKPRSQEPPFTTKR